MTTLDRYIQDNKHFLESVFRAVKDGVVILDLDFNIVLVNGWVENKYASQSPLTGKKAYTAFRERDDSPLEGPYKQVIETGNPYTMVLPYLSAQGLAEWFEFSWSRLEEGDKKILGIIGHITDITERKLTEEMLKNEIDRRRLLVDQSRDGIVVLDQKGKVFEANQQYAQMLGYTLEEVRQLHVWDWDTQWPKEHLLEMIRTVDEAGDHFETSHRRKDGSFYDVEISTNGSIYRGQKQIFCICRDITERKRAQKERERLINELQEALKEIKTLRGILPICSFCKKVRNDKGYWEQVDVYIHKHSQADISHGICPECMQKYYPEEHALIEQEEK